MTKNKIRNLLDFIPLVILTVSTIILAWKVSVRDTVFLWKHIVGFIFLALNIVAFWWRHKIGVLVSGLILMGGLLGFLSYSYGIITSTFSIGTSEDFRIFIFYGDPIFLLWLLIHFIVSGRHYIGIGTRKYWHDLFDVRRGSALD